MSERKLILFEIIKYIIVGHPKLVFEKYLVQLQKLTSKTQIINLIIRNKEKNQPSWETKKKKKLQKLFPSFVTNLQ